jgi:hypothetical protein
VKDKERMRIEKVRSEGMRERDKEKKGEKPKARRTTRRERRR